MPLEGTSAGPHESGETTPLNLDIPVEILRSLFGRNEHFDAIVPMKRESCADSDIVQELARVNRKERTSLGQRSTHWPQRMHSAFVMSPDSTIF